MTKKNTYESKKEASRSDPQSIWKIFKELGASRKVNSCESNINIKLGEQLITNESDLSISILPTGSKLKEKMD